MSWPPLSEADLNAAITAGSLTEVHRVELKRQLNSGPNDNVELARDIASLAVDGGLLFIGIEEHEDKPPAVHAVPLSGLRERVEQVARSRIDPPLSVGTADIPIDSDAATGVVVVTVLASPDAPHMVDGKYWGRADSHKHPLTDSEVRRLHAGFSHRQDDFRLALDGRISGDPIGNGRRAHVHGLARPVTSRRGLFVTALQHTTAPRFFHERIINGPPGKQLTVGWHPDLGAASTVSRRAEGWAMHSYYMGSDGRVGDATEEATLLDIEVTEDAEVRLFCGNASDGFEPNKPRRCFESVTNGLAKRLVLIAAELTDAIRFEGTWEFGYAVTNLLGTVSDKVQRDLMGDPTPYSAHTYRETTSATTIDMRDRPDEVASRLIGRLNRSLNNGTVGVPANR